MAVSGGVAVVGAAVAVDDDGNRVGAAYVYRDTGSEWVEEQKLLASDGASGDLFG